MAILSNDRTFFEQRGDFIPLVLTNDFFRVSIETSTESGISATIGNRNQFGMGGLTAHAT